MVVLEAIGAASSDLFSWNREVYEFDNEGRLKRDLNRLEMQMARFELFRQDIEDLVKLTVDKMDMYHLVGALFLAFTTVIYTEGRIGGCVVPPYFIALYFLSVSGAFINLLLAVWLSMHASISSHSFGVRLRTRYIRLPIPSMAQMNKLAAKLADFERAGVGKIFRIPGAGEPGFVPGTTGSASSSSAPSASDGAIVRTSSAGGLFRDEYLGEGEVGFAGEDSFHFSAGADQKPGRHVQLFRRLQAKWQCFDAYARVCMTLGVNQICQSVSYYLIGTMLIQRNSPSTTICLVGCFQAASYILMVIDVSGIRRWQVFLMQLVGAMPSMICIVVLMSSQRDETMLLLTDNEYYLAPCAFFVEVVWFEILLWTVTPHPSDPASLPRKFRSVLYLDVFGSTQFDPTDAEGDSDQPLRPRDRVVEGRRADTQQAFEASFQALRRWEAVPKEQLSHAQEASLASMRRDLLDKESLFRSYMDQVRSRHGAVGPSYTIDDNMLKSWEKLTDTERIQDPFYQVMVGPLNAGRLYDVDKKKMVEIREGMDYLKLEQVEEFVGCVDGLLKSCITDDGSPRAAGSMRPGYDEGKAREFEVADAGLEVNEATSSKRVGGRRLFQDDRLPWKTVRRMTRTIQFCWFFLGVYHTLEVLFPDTFKVDYALKPEERRLRRLSETLPAAELIQSDAEETEPIGVPLAIKPLEVDWLFGSYFQPSSLACLSSAAVGSESDEDASILISSTSITYWARSLASGVGAVTKLELKAARPRSAYPAGASAVCLSRTELSSEDFAHYATTRAVRDHCFWAELVAEERALRLWPARSGRKSEVSVSVPIRGRRMWQHFAGAIVRCDKVADLLPSFGRKGGTWCLLLAGWDGDSIPLAAVELPRSTHIELPGGSEEIVALADAPLAKREAAASLHLDGSSGRMWAAFTDGVLQAWDVLKLRSLGLWHVDLRHESQQKKQRPRSRDRMMRIVGLCEEPDRRNSLSLGRLLFLVSSGKHGSDGEEPRLLEAASPFRKHANKNLSVEAHPSSNHL